MSSTSSGTPPSGANPADHCPAPEMPGVRNGSDPRCRLRPTRHGNPRRGNEPRILRRRRLGAGDHRHDGHVYVVIAHFPGDPSCDPASGGPREVYVRSSADGGLTFGPLVVVPRLGYPNVVDVVITVDDVTDDVYVSFLAYGLTKDVDVLVAKSTDFGTTWTTTKVNGPLCTACDHPWLVAHDDNVYVMYASC